MSQVAVLNTSEARAQHYRNITSCYTDNGFKAIDRHWVYKEELSPNMKKTAIASITAGALSGLVAGGKVGEEMAEVYFYDEDLKKDSLKKQLSRWIGAALGAATGAAISTVLYMVVVEKTDGFKVWREMKINQAFKEHIILHYSDDTVLQQHWCPISLVPMTIPAKTPSGVCYDLEWLLSCSREEGKKIRDPNRNPSFSEDEIVIDYERGVVINKRIRQLLQEDKDQLASDSPLREVLSEQITAINKIILKHYNSAKEAIERRRSSNQIPIEEYLAQLTNFFDRCGKSVEDNLVWA